MLAAGDPAGGAGALVEGGAGAGSTVGGVAAEGTSVGTPLDVSGADAAVVGVASFAR